MSPTSLFNLCLFVIVSLLVVRNIPTVENLSQHWDNLLYRLTPFRVDTVCGGALLAIAVHRWGDIEKLRTPLRMTCLASSALFLWLIHLNLLSRFGYTAVVAGFTSLVGLALCPGPLSRFLSMRALTVTGRYSYCIYLIHPILILHANHFLPRRLTVGSVVVLVCVEFVIVFGVAAFSYRFIEAPILSLRRYEKYRRATVNVYTAT